MLEEVLEIGRRPTDKKGLRFDKKNFKAAPMKIIPPKKKSQEQMSNQMPQHPV
jgi:hypothetical protein